MKEMRIAGVDEVGRGALAGPVICAAVVFAQNVQIDELTDSKRLTRKKRERLITLIKENCVCWSIGASSVDEIDRLNILQATMLAMKRAVESLTIRPDKVLVDGNRLPDLSVPAEAIIKGDLHEPVISAASVVAKVTRDRIMYQFAEKYPNYGFDRHVGYGTSYHLNAIRRHGVTAIHRSSFSPVREVINSNNPEVLL